jgi:hypothetical protein
VFVVVVVVVVVADGEEVVVVSPPHPASIVTRRMKPTSANRTFFILPFALLKLSLNFYRFHESNVGLV